MNEQIKEIMDYQSGDSKNIDLSPAKTKMILELNKDQAKYLYAVLLTISANREVPRGSFTSEHKSLQNRVEDIFFALDKKHNDSIEEIFGKKINDKTLETK